MRLIKPCYDQNLKITEIADKVFGQATLLRVDTTRRTEYSRLRGYRDRGIMMIMTCQ